MYIFKLKLSEKSEGLLHVCISSIELENAVL